MEESEHTGAPEGIDLARPSTISSFGTASQTEAARLSSRLAGMACGTKADEAERLMSDIVREARRLLEEPDQVGGLFGQRRDDGEQYRERYREVNAAVENTIDRLRAIKISLVVENKSLAALNRSLGAAYDDLTSCVREGERVLVASGAAGDAAAECVRTTLGAASAAGTAGERPARTDSTLGMLGAMGRDDAGRLERRLDDLRTTRALAEQAMASVAAFRQHNVVLLAQIEELATVSVPLWQRSMARELGLEEEWTPAAAGRLRRAIRRHAPGGGTVVDVKALEHASEQLIDAAAPPAADA